MKICYYGVRGSLPTPLLPDEVELKVKRFLVRILRTKEYRGLKLKDALQNMPFHAKTTYGGNTPCIYLRIGDEHVILDGGSGARLLGFDLMKQEFGKGNGTARLFFSHTHWDHIQGLPFFPPLFIPGNQFEFCSCFSDLEERLRYQHDGRFFPIDMDYMQSTKSFTQLDPEKTYDYGAYTVKILKQNHPGSSYAFRIEAGGKTFVYSTDVEFNEKNYDELHRAIEFYKDADVLTFDSQYTLDEALNKIDWGHSSIQIGIDVAHDANVKRVVLFHYDPTYSDEKISDIVRIGISYKEKLFPDSTMEIIPAHEGLVIEP
jgi:phosphoribosyl 1,2-cyclic phosphodiesterase